MPATNAPRATEYPSAAASSAIPKHRPTETTTKSSLLLVLATLSISRGTTNTPTPRIPNSTSASLPSVFARSRGARPPPAATAVIAATSTIATMSWITKMPSTFERTSAPTGRSANTRLTTMVLEMQMAAPRKMPSTVDQPSARPSDMPHQNKNAT
jgi:hypothetical protein